jgi:hypothetical protein
MTLALSPLIVMEAMMPLPFSAMKSLPLAIEGMVNLFRGSCRQGDSNQNKFRVERSSAQSDAFQTSKAR